VDAATDLDETPDAAPGEPGSDNGEAVPPGSTRRRRRGRRGRGRTRGDEELADDGVTAEPEDGEASAPDTGGHTAEAERLGRAVARDTDEVYDVGEDAEEGVDDDGAEDNLGAAAEGGGEQSDAGSRRRRRRRRRDTAGPADEAPAPDDPPNTVVHVRDPRSADDLVRGVSGSTRLEAKRQRRREGRDSGRRRAPIVTEAQFLARRESVERRMVVRNAGDRTQVVVLEDGVLVEHFVTRASSASYAGNVYLGRVQNVLASMEAAFVDIGKGRNAVLYAGEVNYDASGLDGRPRKIEQALRSGQSIVVQVSKDPIGHKGARLTSQVSLPGRYLVYVPDGQSAGISRKLPDTERARLKSILKKITPENGGVIVRTAAEGASEQELARDIERLAAQWEEIQRRAERAIAPALLYGEPDLVVRVIRDIFNEDFTELVVQGPAEAATIEKYVETVAPDLLPRVRRHVGPADVFDEYRIDEQLAKALDRKVWLPSGGSLVIDRTEAMTVIDVNTGKFTGKGGNLEETVTKNNLEAAEEIVRQLRLRDIGGIIVIDFIDMVLESNRELVLRRLTECLGRDRTRHQVAEVTSLGLVQMTRKRVGQGLLEAYSQACTHCNGRGLIINLDGATGSGQHTHPAPVASPPHAPASGPSRRGMRAAKAFTRPSDAPHAGAADTADTANTDPLVVAEDSYVDDVPDEVLDAIGAARADGNGGTEADRAEDSAPSNGRHPPATAGPVEVTAEGPGGTSSTPTGQGSPVQGASAAAEAPPERPLVYANASDPDSLTNGTSAFGSSGGGRPAGRRRASRPVAKPTDDLTPSVPHDT
jgi:ribonuclease E